MTIEFSKAVADYVGRHLPARRCSPHTVRSYCNGLASFIEFAAIDTGKSAGDVAPDDLDAAMCDRYVDSLRGSGLKASSVNQRIACLKSFMLYLSRRDLSWMHAWTFVDGIERQREEEPVVSWLTTDAMRLVLSLPDPSTPSGLRDLAALALLYDSAARVQELCDASVRDFDPRARTLTLTGKGGKTRVVPIGRKTCSIASKAIAARGFGEGPDPLVANARGERMSVSGIRYVVGKYVEAAKEADPSKLGAVKVSPHVFRHSKAMHLLEAGVELVYIRDFLGHVSVTTTEVYARASPEAKRKAIEVHASAMGIKSGHIGTDREIGIIEKLKAIGRASH